MSADQPPLADLAGRLTGRLLPLHEPVTPRPGLRPAAVLVLLHANPGEPALLFTRRSELVTSHRGQISFPGGGFEPGDADLTITALRETEEEIGLPRHAVTLVGRLPDLPSISQYQVVPFVGFTIDPFRVLFDPAEVAEVIEVPVRALLSPGVYSESSRLFKGEPVPTYSYEYGGHVIWGLTARVLREFLALLADDRSGVSGDYRHERLHDLER